MIATELVFAIVIFTLSVISVGSLAGSRLIAFRRHMRSLIVDLTDNDNDSLKLFDDKIEQGIAVYGELKWQ